MYEKYLKLLSEYISFQSISTDNTFKNEMYQTAEWLSKTLQDYGFTTELWTGRECNPIVYAKYTHDPKAETILIYGHYDVQPADKADGWNANPFTVTEVKGRLVARGIVDNKGQNLIHVVTVGELIKQNALKYNVLFMIEGNEETANPDIPTIVAKNKKKLACDYIMISDGEISGTTPTIEATLRGGFNMKVTLTTGKSNLHSGIYGGGIPSASHEMTKLLGGLYDKNNKVTIPGFYTDAPVITPAHKKNNASIQSPATIMKTAGVKAITPETGHDFFTQVGLRPTIQVTGIKTGYIHEGYANIVPAQAEARINVRVVGKQNPEKVYTSIVKYFKGKVPKHTTMVIEHTEFNKPVAVDITMPKVKEVTTLLAKAYKKQPIIKYVGGSIPIVSDFKEILGKDTLLVSLGNDDCNMHGINENFRIDLIKKGMEFSKMFFGK